MRRIPFMLAATFALAVSTLSLGTGCTSSPATKQEVKTAANFVAEIDAADCPKIEDLVKDDPGALDVVQQICTDTAIATSVLPIVFAVRHPAAKKTPHPVPQ